MKKRRLSTLIVGASLFLSSVATAHTVNTGHETVAPKRLLPVTASAQIKAAPDKATVSAGVVTEGKNASETASENAVKMTAVFDALTRANIPSSDIRTSQLSLSPRYDYESRKKPRIVGYTANNLVTVTTQDLTKVTPIIDALVQAGSNNIQNVKFSLSDPDAIQAKALEEAIGKARARAQLIARSAGVTLGPLQSINVNNNGYFPNNQSYDEIVVTGGGGGEGGGVSTPVSGGELTISVTVNLVYEML
ncbi:SIMPL domain-containing protein [Hellea sp.]|nr:SIMPL domain-containing protein [Hellea sp.]